MINAGPSAGNGQRRFARQWNINGRYTRSTTYNPHTCHDNPDRTHCQTTAAAAIAA
jgi:hypothetical protein